MKEVALVIPARYESSRFPGKPLAKISGVPLIIRVANICKKAVGHDSVYIATDDNRIFVLCETHGFSAIMTSESCLTGTDRVAEASLYLDASLIINVQGDEPMLNPKDIIKVIDEKRRYSHNVITCMSNLNHAEDPNDLKIPKVVVNNEGELLYASRNAIPASKHNINNIKRKKQVCIYGFSCAELEDFSDEGHKTPLEQSEDLEILRFLELGHTVRMVEVNSGTHAVDVPADIMIVEKLLRHKS